MRLSPNFSLAELTKTETGLDNSPPPEFINRLAALAQTLEMIRGIFGKPVIINSGYRSSKVNSAVGGSNTSAHSLAYAVDFNVKGMKAKEVAAIIANNPLIKFDQLIDEKRNGPGWVHLSIDPKLRRQVLTFRNGVYSNGLTAK